MWTSIFHLQALDWIEVWPDHVPCLQTIFLSFMNACSHYIPELFREWHLDLFNMYLHYFSFTLNYCKMWMNWLFYTSVSHPKVCTLWYRQTINLPASYKWKSNPNNSKPAQIHNKQRMRQSLISTRWHFATPDSGYLRFFGFLLGQTLSLFFHPSCVEAVQTKPMWHGKGKFQQHMLNAHVTYRSAGRSCDV